MKILLYNSHRRSLALISIFFIFISQLYFTSCKKWIEVPAPITSTTSDNVYTSDASAASVLTGIYAELSAQDIAQGASYLTDISIIGGLSADELTLYDKDNLTYSYYYINNLSSTTAGGAIWSNIYSVIYQVNAALEGVNSSNSLTPSVKQQLLGEAYFLRGYLYFYLTALYGDVALALTTDYKTNALLARTSRTLVYQQIESDLKNAQSLLSSNYLDGTLLVVTSNRVRPTKWAAAAMMAKTCLYSGDFTGAESEADTVIANTGLFHLDNLQNVFLPISQEAIWQLQPVGSGNISNTGEGEVFVLPETGPNTLGNYPVILNQNLVNSFETNDQRRQNWVDSVIVSGVTYYFPYKYKAGAEVTLLQEYLMMIRLGEVFLIRAEARTQLNEIAGAQSDLNAIRERAGLTNTFAGDKTSLLSAVLQERRVELFTEWGSRWFDMQRFGLIDPIMDTVAPQKSGSWMTYKELFPVSSSDILADRNLIQTPGY